jgi:protein phosphatase
VEVEVTEVDGRPGDRFLLCTDGLSGVIEDAEIARVLSGAPPERAVRELVDAANRRGGPDNVTVMVALREAAPRRRPGPAAWIALALALAAGLALLAWLGGGA